MTPDATTWADVAKWAIAWGPGLIILFGLFRLLCKPPECIGQFLLAQQAQAVAMQQMADAIKLHTAEGDRKLDEVLVGQQLILTRMEALDRRLADGPR
jgi:hypothetical protein